MDRMEGKTTSFARRKGELSNDVIESIFRRLPDVDLVRTKALSSFWNSFTESLLTLRNIPFLILPPPQKGEDEYVNVQERMAYPLKMKTLDTPTQTCIGSSHGWLIFSDIKTLIPVLVNPLTEEKMVLPSLKSSLGIVEIEETNSRQYRYLTESGWEEIDIYDVYGSFVEKAILTGDPASGSDYGVVFLCCHRGNLMLLYYKKGDISWRNFFAREWDITTGSWDWKDVISNHNRIHLLQVPEDGDYWICSWEIHNGYPENMILVKPGTIPETLLEFDREKKLDLDGSYKSYLVELKGEFLLLFRVVGFSGKSEDRTNRTWGFFIFKLDAEKKRWKKVKDLGHNVAIFVGKNHSMAVCTAAKFGNRIYFTHVPTFRHQSGQDIGFYRVNGKELDGRIKPVFGFPKQVQLSQVPCWLLPSSI